jgi:hypothetical protein
MDKKELAFIITIMEFSLVSCGIMLDLIYIGIWLTTGKWSFIHVMNLELSMVFHLNGLALALSKYSKIF